MKITFIKKTALASLVCAAILLVSWTRNGHSVTKYLSDEAVFEGLVFMKGELVGLIPEVQEAAILQAKLNPAALEQQRLAKIHGEMIQYLKAKHPGYLPHFKSVMTSGNHYAIRAELEKSNEMTSEALGAVLGIDLRHSASKQEAIAKLLSDKAGLLKELYRQFKAGEINEQAFKAATEKALADKKEKLLALLPGATDISTASVNSGHCLSINITVAINIAGALNVAAAINLAAAINIYVFNNIYFWDSRPEVRMASPNSFDHQQLVNSIAERLKG
jgi:SdpC family antimicrobial peptide